MPPLTWPCTEPIDIDQPAFLEVNEVISLTLCSLNVLQNPSIKIFIWL